MPPPSYFEAVPPLGGKLKGYPVQCRHTNSILMFLAPSVLRTPKLLGTSSAIACIQQE